MASPAPTTTSTETPPLFVAVLDGTHLIGTRCFDRVSASRQFIEELDHSGLRGLPVTAAFLMSSLTRSTTPGQAA